MVNPAAHIEFHDAPLARIVFSPPSHLVLEFADIFTYHPDGPERFEVWLSEGRLTVDEVESFRFAGKWRAEDYVCDGDAFDETGQTVNLAPPGSPKDIAGIRLLFWLDGAELQVTAGKAVFELIGRIEKQEDWIGPLRN